MADRQEDLVVEQQAARAVRVDARDVADVVPVLLEELDHRELVGEEVVLASRCVGGEHRAVVADLVGAAVVSAAGVEVRAAVGVVGLPGRVRGLVDDVGVAGVVADDEEDLALVTVVGPGQVRHVDTGHGRARYGPGGRHTPVAAVVEVRRLVADAGRLGLRERRRGCDGRDLTRSVATVVAHAVDGDRVVARTGVDLEALGLAHIDADVGREALDVGVARPLDGPY